MAVTDALYISCAQDEIIQFDLDTDYHITLIDAGKEPPPLAELPADLLIDPDAEDDLSIIGDSSIDPSVLLMDYRSPRSIPRIMVRARPSPKSPKSPDHDPDPEPEI